MRICATCSPKKRTPPGSFCKLCGSGTDCREFVLCNGCAITHNKCQRCQRRFTGCPTKARDTTTVKPKKPTKTTRSTRKRSK